jgi:hypothetical protein
MSNTYQPLNIVNQQLNQIGMISKRNLNTFNPPELNEGLDTKFKEVNNRNQQLIYISPVSQFGIIEKNLRTYNPPNFTGHIKKIKRDEYLNVAFESSPEYFNKATQTVQGV